MFINVAALLVVAVAFRLWRLGSLPGVNGDEAWFGVQAVDLISGRSVDWRTPSGNILPQFEGKILTSALNVPVQEGCLLDVTLVIKDASVTVEAINDAMRRAASRHEGIVSVTEDPIVSSDVIGNASSLLFDARGTVKAGSNTIKTLSWYESLGHAARLLDVARIYRQLDQQQEAA